MTGYISRLLVANSSYVLSEYFMVFMPGKLNIYQAQSDPVKPSDQPIVVHLLGVLVYSKAAMRFTAHSFVSCLRGYFVSTLINTRI